MTVVTSDNRYGVAQLIVAPTIAQGANYTTIQAAITAASSGQTIFIRPGTYTENLTLKAGVNLAAFECDAFNPNVTIIGTCTFTAAGTVAIWGIRLQTNSAFLLAVTGSAASIVWLRSCYLNCTNNTGISYTSSNAASGIRIDNCFGDIGTTGISLFTSTSSGPMGIVYTQITNSGASTTASTVSTASINTFECNFNIPFTSSSTGTLNIQSCIIQTSTTNTTAITTAGTSATNAIVNSNILSGSASAISVGSGTTLNFSTSSVSSTNTNAITGAGTINIGDVTFTSSSSTINTTTTNYLVTTNSRSGSLVLIQTQTASSSASLAFTTGITSTYNAFLLIYTNYTPATNATSLQLQYSTNGGSTYISTGYQSGTNANNYNNNTWTNVSATNSVLLMVNAQTGTTNKGFIHLLDLSSGAVPIALGTALNGVIGAQELLQSTSTSTTINAFQVLSSSGNMTTGVFSLYGIVK